MALTVSKLATELCFSVAHTRRLAAAGVIPETLKTKGGHYRFRATPALKRWITRMQPERPYRQQVIEKAYDHYRDPRRKRLRRWEEPSVGYSFIPCKWAMEGIRWLRRQELDDRSLERILRELRPLAQVISTLEADLATRLLRYDAAPALNQGVISTLEAELKRRQQSARSSHSRARA